MVVGDHLPRFLGDFGVFMVDAHHPPRNAKIVVYDRPAAPLEPSTMIDASFSVVETRVFDSACDFTLI